MGRVLTLVLSILVPVRKGDRSGGNGGVDATQEDKARGPELEGLAEALPYQEHTAGV